MTKAFYKIRIIILLVCTGIACNKQKDFPDERSEGKDVFGCFLNGKTFLPCADILQWRVKAEEYFSSPPYYSISVSARNECEDKYQYGRYVIISFDSVQIEENKIYKFGNFRSQRKGQVSVLYSENLLDYESDSALNGTITIRKFDIQRKILSGNFEAMLKQKYGTGRAISLTRGTFDVSLQP